MIAILLAAACSNDPTGGKDVTSIRIFLENEEILVDIPALPGDTLELKAQVGVKGGADNSVTWTLEGNEKPGTKINASIGRLTIDKNEPKGALTITATSLFRDKVKKSVTVAIDPEGYAITYEDLFSSGYINGPSRALKDEIVTLTVIPNGNILRKLFVTRSNGSSIKVSGSDNERTFTMPASNVSIAAEFDVPTPDGYFSENFDVTKCSFYDKFDGTELDFTKWAYQNGDGSNYGNPGWGNQEDQGYDPSGVIVENGILRLEARNERNSGKPYTSGKIVTANARAEDDPGPNKGNKFSQKYGRFEAKIKLSKAIPGAWPAFWMMPVASEYGAWPRSGEIDIMEMVGASRNQASSTVHFYAKYGTWDGNKYHGREHKFENDDVADITQWHIYGLVWKPNEIIFIIDGKQMHKLNKTWANSFYEQTTSPYDKDFHLILNLATNGNFSGESKINPALLPVSLDIDWVRCYTQENDPWEIYGVFPLDRAVSTYY